MDRGRPALRYDCASNRSEFDINQLQWTKITRINSDEYCGARVKSQPVGPEKFIQMVPALKSIAKTILPRNTIAYLKRVTRREMTWPPVPFDNTYEWLNYIFSELRKDGTLTHCPPQYAWGVMQGAALAKVLGLPRVSVIEFGVAGGSGLLSLEKISEVIERKTNIGIDVFGFDSGVGLPKGQDFRDQPNMWLEGQFPMDRGRLEPKLSRAKLCLGPVKETIPRFVAGNPAPVGFVSFDLDLYSSTRDALPLFKSNYALLLPRVVSYFDDIFGYTYNDYCGERAAITEFNSFNSTAKICPIHGLRYFIPQFARSDLWPDGMYFAHFFEHPLYKTADSFNKVVAMDVNGTWHWQLLDRRTDVRRAAGRGAGTHAQATSWPEDKAAGESNRPPTSLRR